MTKYFITNDIANFSPSAFFSSEAYIKGTANDQMLSAVAASQTEKRGDSLESTGNKLLIAITIHGHFQISSFQFYCCFLLLFELFQLSRLSFLFPFFKSLLATL